VTTRRIGKASTFEEKPFRSAGVAWDVLIPELGVLKQGSPILKMPLPAYTRKTMLPVALCLVPGIKIS
jgi:hypothetical protein